jgi:hypothetical protein
VPSDEFPLIRFGVGAPGLAAYTEALLRHLVDEQVEGAVDDPHQASPSPRDRR